MNSGTMRVFILYSKDVSGRWGSKEQIKREVYEDHPKAIWVQLMNQVFSLPKLFSPLLAFGMRK